jgi:hypothetical protein
LRTLYTYSIVISRKVLIGSLVGGVALTGCGGSSTQVASAPIPKTSSLGAVTVNAVLTQEPVILAGTQSTTYGVAGTISDVTYTNTNWNWQDGYFVKAEAGQLVAYDFEQASNPQNPYDQGTYVPRLLSSNIGFVDEISADRQGNNIVLGRTVGGSIRFNPSSRAVTALPASFGRYVRITSGGTRVIYAENTSPASMFVKTANLDGSGVTTVGLASAAPFTYPLTAPVQLFNDPYFFVYINEFDAYQGWFNAPSSGYKTTQVTSVRTADGAYFSLNRATLPHFLQQIAYPSGLSIDRTSLPGITFDFDVSSDGEVYGALTDYNVGGGGVDYRFDIFRRKTGYSVYQAKIETAQSRVAFVPLPSTRKVIGAGGNFGTTAAGLVTGTQKGKPRSYLTWQATTPSTSRLRSEVVGTDAETHVMTAEANAITQVRYSNDARLFSAPITTPASTNAVAIALDSSTGKIASVITYAITRSVDKPQFSGNGSTTTISGNLGEVFDGEGNKVATSASQVTIKAGKLTVL